jgi:gamma-glutamyltranspeptidase/glutathione hydrolase
MTSDTNWSQWPEQPWLGAAILQHDPRDLEGQGYGEIGSIEALRTLAGRGFDAIVLEAHGYVSTSSSPFIEDGFDSRWSTSDQRLARMVAAAHAQGLRVVLRPRLFVQQGGSSEQIAMRDGHGWRKWFAELGRWMAHYAMLAEGWRIDVLEVGSHLGGTTHRVAEWRALIHDLRARYRGPLSYLASELEELSGLAFARDLDLVGVSVDLASIEGPSQLRESLHGAATRNRRPVWIGELLRDPRFGAAGEEGTEGSPWPWESPWEDAGWLRGIAEAVGAEVSVAQEAPPVPLGWTARRVLGRGGVVVSSDSIATEVGLEVLRAGGNAADAAVAVAFALAVTYPEAGNLGGGGFLIRFDERLGRATALDFREIAPAAMHERSYEELRRRGIEDASKAGPLSAAIPGTVAGMFAVWEREGLLPWDRLVRPAFDLALNGFRVGAHLAQSLRDEAERLAQYSQTRARFLPGGRPLPEGAWLRQPALAEVLRALMREGPGVFYRGWVGRALVGGVTSAGGLWTEGDLAAYRVRWRPAAEHPLDNEGRMILLAMGPPSSGAPVLGQSWELLRWQPDAAGPLDSALRARAFVESLRLSFADRNTHLADPVFMSLDWQSLLEPSYLRRRARLLPRPGEIGRSSQIRGGMPPLAGRRRGSQSPQSPREPDETTHIVVIDSSGGAISLTTTLNDRFGSGFLESRTGILLNDQMDDFDTRPGEPNMYGLIGGGANAVRGGARPLSSMSPCIVLRDGRTWLALGGRGGPRILSSVLQVLRMRIVDGLPLDRAISAPRLHHQWLPDRIDLERDRTWPGLGADLGELGYEVHFTIRSGKIHAAERLEDGALIGVADPRDGGRAGVVE